MCASTDFHRIVLKAAGCGGHLRARVRDQGAPVRLYRAAAALSKLKTEAHRKYSGDFASPLEIHAQFAGSSCEFGNAAVVLGQSRISVPKEALL